MPSSKRTGSAARSSEPSPPPAARRRPSKRSLPKRSLRFPGFLTTDGRHHLAAAMVLILISGLGFGYALGHAYDKARGSHVTAQAAAAMPAAGGRSDTPHVTVTAAAAPAGRAWITDRVSVSTKTAGPIIGLGTQGDSDFPRFKDRGKRSSVRPTVAAAPLAIPRPQAPAVAPKPVPAAGRQTIDRTVGGSASTRHRQAAVIPEESMPAVPRPKLPRRPAAVAHARPDTPATAEGWDRIPVALGASPPAIGAAGPVRDAGMARPPIREPKPAGRSAVAIIIDDIGMDRPGSARAIQLPGPITLAFLPYAEDLQSMANAARHAGHELLVHLPMEPSDPSIDPGPQALLTRLSASDLQRRLVWNLSRFTGFVGVNNHMGSRFTPSVPHMSAVMAALRRRGLIYVDSRTNAQTVGLQLARQFGLRAAERDIFLDHDPSIRAVFEQLRQVEQLAREQGHVVAIGHPYDATLTALEGWLPTLAGRGFDLVPVSAVAERPTEIAARPAGRY